MHRRRKVADRVKKNGMNAIKVSVSSRHYDMEWVVEEIFGNWNMGGGDMPPSNPRGAEPDSVTFHKEGKKKALHICRGLVRRHGYEQISCFLQGSRSWEFTMARTMSTHIK